MYTLNKPNFSLEAVLNSCVDAIEDADLVARLNTVKSKIEANEPLYDREATNGRLDLIPRNTSVGLVTKEEMIALYSDYLSATRGSARAVYDAIRNSAPNKLCPLCSIGSVAHIDHYLPKTKYPDLSILPLNLVPSCNFCNDRKKARYPKTVGEQTFHPYYDAHLLTQRWISAKIDHSPPLIIIFSVTPPHSWSITDQQRVARHFTVCGLGTSYGTNANANLVPLKRRLKKLYEAGGASAVQAHLEEERDCHYDKPNSWQYASFQALAADDWFVNGGFNEIADSQI